MKSFIPILLFISFLYSCDTPQDISDPKVDKIFAEINNSSDPGCALGVIKDGELIYSKGYGMADLEHGIPINNETIFYIGSVSKQFVTMCILLLEEEEKLDLDAEIQTYLPDFPRYEAPLTLRHFVHHTSGVRDNLTLWSLTGKDYLDYIDDDAIYELIKRQKELNFTPGDRYMYSNSCYFMLSKVVENVSGQSLREYAQQNIFKPLNMNNTHFHDNHKHIIKNRAFSYGKTDSGFDNLIMRFDLVGSGGLYTNVKDMLLWDRNFYDNKLGKGNPDLIKKMHEDGVLNNGESAEYAFALVNGEYRGLRTVSHSGALAGYRAELMRFPDQNFSVILLGNYDTFNSTGKAHQVAEAYLGDLMSKPENQFSESQSQNEEVMIDQPSDLSQYIGSFYNEELDVSYVVFEVNNTLNFTIGYSDSTTLTYTGNDTFRGNFELAFIRDNDLITGFVLNADRVRNLRFEKL